MHTLFSALREYCEEHDARNDALFAAGDAVGLAEPTVPSRVPAEDKAERKRSMMRHFARLIEPLPTASPVGGVCEADWTVGYALKLFMS